MRYAAPTSAADAVALLKNETAAARVLAGGSDLLVQLNANMVEPALVVDIKRIPGIRDITAENGGFRVGAAVTGAEMGEHAGLLALWPGVVEAVELIGSTQIQGRATMVGNLCNGSPAADSVPALMAAGAVAGIAGPDGVRDCPVAEIPVSPGKTSLAAGEFITSIFLPERAARSADAYLRFIPRTEMDIAVASAGVSLTLGDDGAVSEARVAVGAVAPTVLLVPEAAACLVGGRAEPEALQAMGAACSAVANPIDDKRGTVEYRTEVVAVLAKRAAKIAFARAGER